MKEWYCVRSKVKQERVAYARLSSQLEVECYLPMISKVLRGKNAGKKVAEPLFPGYFFVRVDLLTELRKVNYAQGVSGFVRSGDRFPIIKQEVIAAIIRFCEELEDENVFSSSIQEGDDVELIGQLMDGTKGKVLKLIPAKNRIRILVEFLNNMVEMEVDASEVIKADADF